MGRDEDYFEQKDRERSEAQISQMYEDWATQDTATSDARVLQMGLEAARVRDTEAIRNVFGVYATYEREQTSPETPDVPARAADKVASARAMAREAEKAPGVSKADRRFLSLLWETLAVQRELDALGDAPQGLDHARAEGLKAQLEDLKRQAEREMLEQSKEVKKQAAAASRLPKLHWSRKGSED